MGTVETYKGYPIVVYRTLGSGQTTYMIQGIPEEEVDFYGRTEQSTVKEAQIIIDKYLGGYVAPAYVREVMSQETLDQLNAGTLALHELSQVKLQEATRVGLLEGILTDIGGVKGQVEEVDEARIRLEEGHKELLAFQKAGYEEVIELQEGEYRKLIAIQE